MSNPGKFAQITFSLFHREGRFQISLSQGQDVEQLALEYRLLGCRVEIDPSNRWLVIQCD